jgi:hypothetical protein
MHFLLCNCSRSFVPSLILIYLFNVDFVHLIDGWSPHSHAVDRFLCRAHIMIPLALPQPPLALALAR